RTRLGTDAALAAASSRAACGGLLPARLLLLLASLRRRDARLERLHEVDHRSFGDRLRNRDLLAAKLRLEQCPQVPPVFAAQLRRLELSREALDDLPRELELGVHHLRPLDSLRDPRLRVDVLGAEARREGQG